MELSLRPEHGYAAAVIIGSTFVPFWAGTKVAGARKKFGIEYPQMYAEKDDKNAKAFNCYQRAHQNILENFPQFLTLMALSSLHRPGAAAIAGTVRLAGFVAYAKGYQTGEPKKRMNGAFGYLGLFALLGMSVELAYRLITSA